MSDQVKSDGWAVFEQAPGPMALADEALIVTHVNDAFCRLVGHPRERIVGRDGYAFMAGEQRETARGRIAELLDDGKTYAVDQRFTHADGNDVWLRVRVGRVIDPTGQRWLMAHVEDTTEHRLITERLRELHRAGDPRHRRGDGELRRRCRHPSRPEQMAVTISANVGAYASVPIRMSDGPGGRRSSSVTRRCARGPAGEAIPISSRIVFACDAWDAMTSHRPYRPGLPRDEALAELSDGAGSQFRTRYVQALITVLASG